MKSEERIIKARSKLMKGNVGMATMLLKLTLVREDEKCQTMATDGVNIYWNDEFVKSITDEEIQAVLIHEASHVIWEHPLRKGNRDHQLWNIATDYVINGWLKYDLRMELPEDGLLDRKYHGMSAEAVYRTLSNDDEALDEAIDQINNNANDGDADQSAEDGETSNSNEGQTLAEKLADLPQLSGEVWVPTNEDGKELSPTEMAELQEELQRTIMMADKLEGIGDNAESSLGKAVKQMNRSCVNWVDVMRDFLQSAMSKNPTWSRLNKRHSWRGVNLPSHDKEPHGGEIVVAIDTSGSVTQEELNIFATETQNLAEECGVNKIRVCYCDTRVHKNSHGEWWDEYDLECEELEFHLRGGGGTDFNPPFNLFNDYTDNTDDVLAFIYFTDGGGYVDKEVEPDVPVIWALTTTYYQDYYKDMNFPFGEEVVIDMSSL